MAKKMADSNVEAAPARDTAPEPTPETPPKKGRKKPKNKGGRPRHPRWLKSYAEIGDLPSDPLAAVEWGFKALMVSLSLTLKDPNLREEQRSHQIRQHLRSMKDVMPKARIAEAERRIEAFERRMNAPTRPAEGEATVSDVTADAGSEIRSDYRTVRARRS